ncbi:MAG: N-6 DNA methylase [Methanosarcinales archaeon]|uniref:site-specific DNA-methyltransferase (adenine-specific) n=1 Tax=Candidatus Ethanoperedens thermophilum TaxID=2766897 RepID=A0A848DBK7_9EURY|nr:N-6 DNA methylase [Candidatus Ethanoperedens thermophilum]
MSITRDMLARNEPVKIALGSAGFLTDSGDFVEGLVDSKNANKDYEMSLRHRLIIDESQKETKIDFIYETPATLKGMPGHPCIYFKIVEVDDASAQQVTQIRKRVWNTGRAPVLWLISPTQVRIYDAFARPEEEDTEKSHILDVLKLTSDGLEGVERFRRELFDTGQFWESGEGQHIDRNQCVDASLLDDLWDTERILTPDDEGGIPVRIAHTLIGRAIFMAYLWDRKIITSEFLNAEFEHSDMKGLLTDKKQLYKFFRWLRSTFNGDLFPIDADEEDLVDDIHLELICKLFDGTDMGSIEIDNNKIKSFQKRLWPYNFDIIPIELISSIYEMFAHSKDSVDARAKSIHYIKLHLVELVTSLAMLDLPDDARILDPACGSGVFLVDAFRRLVWKKRFNLKRELKRDEICNILLNQIYGVDIEQGAIELTAFSLYLALLELDESFTDPNDIKFPKLIYHAGWREGHHPVLYNQDIADIEHVFNRNEPFADRKFDLIIGNPPWTKLNKKTAPRDPENPKSGRQWLLEYCLEHNIPHLKPDQAIMVRVRDFARADTRIALIVSSRIFYQLGAGGKFWLSSFLEDNSIFMTINLSDIAGENILFGGKTHGGGGGSPGMPGSVIFYNPQTPDNDSCVTYICPKWYPSIRKRGEIVIHPPDIQTISLILLRDNPHLWKIAFLGSQRDFELIKKLTSNPTLKAVLHKIGISGKKYGRGYFMSGTPKPATKYIGYPNLESKEDYKYCTDSKELPKFQYETLGAPKDIDIYKGPLLIFRRSLKDGETRIAFTSEDTVYNSTYMGISFDGVDERYAHRINAIFNSKFALYLAFMLSRELGWYRNLIEPSDWRKMPLPESIFDLDDDSWDEVVTIENELCESWRSASPLERKELEDSLFKSVCDLYGLNENERIIVDDMIQYTIDLYLNRKKAKTTRRGIKSLTIGQLQRYADRLCRQLNSILKFEGKILIYTVYDIGGDSPLSVVEFKQVSQTKSNQKNSTKRVEGIEKLLIKISKNLQNQISERVYVWGHLRVYEREHLYIIKPSEKRFWSESAALNDADTVIRDHMGAVNGSL